MDRLLLLNDAGAIFPRQASDTPVDYACIGAGISPKYKDGDTVAVHITGVSYSTDLSDGCGGYWVSINRFDDLSQSGSNS